MRLKITELTAGLNDSVYGAIFKLVLRPRKSNVFNFFIFAFKVHSAMLSRIVRTVRETPSSDYHTEHYLSSFAGAGKLASGLPPKKFIL